MLTQGSGFAKYSKSLSWMVSFIWLALSLLAFTSDSESATLNGFLWLAGAFAFAISAIFLSKNSQSSDAVEEESLD
ncbi:MAG: hypothetical protein COA96_08480 [SAR86 cluster bacterium]|uniref:Uncharacterized protein n=1 Tax=SAR86 cluster bacterium TaxID=2030880 RepID=A0A2A5B0H9_9GAMM|nr:MAG: hypothetical protein COA96_08480 [SAR86 cluster bacterium]